MTNGEPPPAKVTDLQADKEGPLCPDETVKFEATTSPPKVPVTWTVAVNGGTPQPVTGTGDDGNTLKVFGASGQIVVVTAALTNPISKTRKWKVADLQINVPPGPDNGRYVITDEPRMPAITATALFQGESGTLSEWDVSADFSADDCPPFGPDDLRTTFRFSQTGGNAFTAHFPDNVIRGGVISFTATGIVSGCTVSAEGGAGLVGTNPQLTDIENFLKQKSPDTYRTLQRIACKESGQRQFNALPDGGTGFCPLFGPGGKVGIMQIAKPTDDQVWNWKENVTAGIEKFKQSVAAAEDYHNKVMQSEGFQDLVERFNQRRQQQGLEIIKEVVLLRLQEGDFNADDDSELQQRELDAIRVYNHSPDEDATEDDSTDKDRFGLPLHEYRVVVDLIDGEELLRVANITNSDEGTLRGEAVWERVPLADRDTGRLNYVEEVLAFAFDCTAHTIPCNLTGISPATQTLFVGNKPFRFTAAGTGLAGVQWKADGGSPKTGTGATFETKWSKTGQKTVTASCGGTTKTATVFVFDLEIQINNTESTKDDIVQVMCDHPPHVFIVPCQIRVKDPRPTAPVRIDLLDPNHRLRFSLPADTTVGSSVTVDVPTDGNWVPFEIAGGVASEKKGDAQIKAFYLSEAVAVKNVTVFTFDKAKISLKQGGNYVLVGDDYRLDNGVAVSFSATARLRPAGLDCAAPQIANLRVGIVAEIANDRFRRTTTYDRPSVKWVSDPSLPPVPRGTKVTVKNKVLEEILYDSGPLNMSISRVDGAAPLWDDAAAALKPPTGCTGAGAATSFAAPQREGLSPTTKPEVFSSDDHQVTKAAEVTWTRLKSTTLQAVFHTYCVVVDTTGTEKKFCALRHTGWALDVDSGRRAKQHASVPPGDGDAPTFDPAPPPQDDPKFITRLTQVDAATTTFTKDE